MDRPARRFFIFGCIAFASLASLAAAAGCSSSDSNGAPGTNAGDGAAEGAATTPAPTPQPPPASLDATTGTDAGADADAGFFAKILSPTNGQVFTTADSIPLSGTDFDPAEGTIADQTRVTWGFVTPLGINPEGEGLTDTLPPQQPGSYQVILTVKNLADASASDQVSITVTP